MTNTASVQESWVNVRDFGGTRGVQYFNERLGVFGNYAEATVYDSEAQANAACATGTAQQA